MLRTRSRQDLKTDTATTANKTDSLPELPSREEFDQLVRDADSGDPEKLTELRQFLDDHGEIWEQVGDLAGHARAAMIKLIAAGNQLVQESLVRTTAAMTEELAGRDPSPLEVLAVDRVVACWLETQFVDTAHPYPSGETLKEAKFALQLKESAQRRYHAALKSLMLVRKMLPQPKAESASAEEGPSCCSGNGHGHGPHTTTVRPAKRQNENRFTPANRLNVYAAEPVMPQQKT